MLFQAVDVSDLWCDYDEVSGKGVQVTHCKVTFAKNKNLS